MAEDKRWIDVKIESGIKGTEMTKMYDGEILEVHFWPRALPAHEVVKIYGAIRDGSQSDDCDCLICNPVPRDSLTVDLDVGDTISVLKPDEAHDEEKP